VLQLGHDGQLLLAGMNEQQQQLKMTTRQCEVMRDAVQCLGCSQNACCWYEQHGAAGLHSS
jgi:hypothetical protein